MKEQLKALLSQAMQRLQVAKKLTIDIPTDIQIDKTRDAKFGDYASNIALILAKNIGMKPQEFAELLVSEMPKSRDVARVEVVKPGFINFFMTDASQQVIVQDILEARENFGQTDFGQRKRVIVEFVSSNPTGPLHVGHGRCAAYGSVSANLLQAIGYDVHREYYVNDAGRQMDILAVSIWLRYLEACKEPCPFPSKGYQGDYIRDIATDLKSTYNDQLHFGIDEVYRDVPKDAFIDDSEKEKEAHIDALIVNAKKLLQKDYELLHCFGADKILQDIQEDLAEFGVHFEEWFSEKRLVKSGAVEGAINTLKEQGYVVEKEGATWFQSTSFGDEKDRVLIKENGDKTYFASDVAYHWDKVQRGFDVMVDVFGADHHGYVPRIKAAVEAIGFNVDHFKIPLVQFAVLYRQGKRVSMSTRGGKFVTLRELREEVGNDAARFFYVMQKMDHHLDFDLDLAKSQSNDNPVYYIQYAHARICSVFRQLAEKGLAVDQILGLKSLGRLDVVHEKELIKRLASYPEIILASAQNLEPHQLTHYLRELANAFHAYYNAHHFIVDDEALRQARLCLIKATQQTIKNGLNLLGVLAPETM